MDIESLSKVIMIRSCEEEDQKGHFLSLHDRRRTIQDFDEAQMAEHTHAEAEYSHESIIIDRAKRLTQKLESRYSTFYLARRLVLIQVPLFLILGLAFLGGLLTDPIGPEHQINLLYFPLLVLVAWNASIYIWSMLRYVFPIIGDRYQGGCGAEWFNKMGLWVSQLKILFFQRTDQEKTRWITASVKRFFRLWSAYVGEVAYFRGKSVLHWGAAGLALGVIIGLYVRGYVFEYRASWASTFLEAQDVHHLLSVILFPASMLLGIDFPSVQTLAALQAPQSEIAATWIHLWAVTCLLFIVLPRIGLALVARRKAVMLLEELQLPLDHPYFNRILSQYRSEKIWVEVVPYQCQLDVTSIEKLEGLCLEIFGNSTSVQTRPSLSYGQTEIRLEPSSHMPLRVLIVFDLATTPEQEVHGEFLRNMQRQIEHWTAEAALLVCVNEGPYANKHKYSHRPRERYHTWRRFTGAYGLTPLLFSSSIDLNDLLQQVSTKLWMGHSQEVL